MKFIHPHRRSIAVGLFSVENPSSLKGQELRVVARSWLPSASPRLDFAMMMIMDQIPTTAIDRQIFELPHNSFARSRLSNISTSCAFRFHHLVTRCRFNWGAAVRFFVIRRNPPNPQLNDRYTSSVEFFLYIA